MALEGALSALGAGTTRVPLPSAALTPEEEAADTANEQNPAVRAELEKEVARPNLHPVARRVLQDYLASSAAPHAIPEAAQGDMALSGALDALNDAKPMTPPKVAEIPAPNVSEEPKSLFKGPARDIIKAAGSMVASPGAAIAGGYEGMWTLARDLASGKSFDEASTNAAKVVTARQGAVAFEPESEAGRVLQNMMGSKFNPLNWPSMLAKTSGEINQDVMNLAAEKLQAKHPELADKVRSAGAVVGTATETAGNAALLIAGQKAVDLNRPIGVGADRQMGTVPISEAANQVLGPPAANLDVPTYLRRQQAARVPLSQVATGGTPAAQAMPTPAAAGARPVAPVPARALPGEQVSTTPPQRIDLGLKPPAPGTPAAAVEAPAVKGGLPAAVQGERAAVLQRLGIQQAWQAAVKGDAFEGAVNAQLAKFVDQPAGQKAFGQFMAETEGLQKATTELATKAGGTLGVGEAADFARGAKIAQPFDKLRAWFDQQEAKLYKAADAKTAGMPVVSPAPVEALLKDRTFKNSVMARDKGHLLTAIEDQLNVFKETNPQGLTVKNAEQFRQWLNQQWSHDNSAIIGQVKTAVDKAVSQAAGEDVYATSRAMHIAKKATLEDPKGIARLMDVDPRNPINRATAIEKIPQTIERLSVDQFKNVVDTLRAKMPPELRGASEAAQAEMKAHFVQGILDAGTPNTKTPSPFWNNRRVNDYLAANEQKMSYLFTKDELARLADIRSGGNIIAVDASYPGAAAQATRAAKHGMLSGIISPLMTSAGGGVGSVVGSIVGAPFAGAAVGAEAGRRAGARMSTAAAEKSALKAMQKRIVPISEMTK